MNTIYIHRKDFVNAREEIAQKQSRNLEDPTQLFLKRSFDLFVSLMVMVFICSWLFPLIALVIKLSSNGPVAYKQLRHGKNNIPFYCFRFRTGMLSETTSDSRPEKVTKVGSWLRRTGLEDLPQVYNVIRGEMSLVGPKAYPVFMNIKFAEGIEGFTFRYAVNPGIVSLGPPDRLGNEPQDFFGIYTSWKLDSFYVRKWSLPLDWAILAGKVAAVIFKKKR